ncbi:HEAT repeat domain-containing protein [Paractinoplanes lichenicola]|uniref:HEAT repeat domain-containing protein n=1 Tax=Paractinoplanes lichenicola TaxID=2802976 RepID=A0ABS1VTB5_9ACTN|nr:HEAT repeat domain-containing protein [Actinoplanes lichenicola]MBL7257704.1 HEAT repeat domain-containing protein [Actinoplanes lichenicola]
MLETLDDVPWSDLHHASGSAEDVPARLRSLLSGDAEVRRQARRACHDNLVHQGLRYEASARAVPFLLEMLDSPSTPERAELIELLVALAIGDEESWLSHGAEPAGPEARAHETVGRGVPLFARLLDDDEAGVRRMAAFALGWFPASAATSVPALAWALLDADESVAATAALSLGLAGEVHRLAVEALGASFAGPRVLLRGASAIGLARLQGRDVPAPVVDELRRWAAGGEPTGVPFAGGDLSGYAASALREVKMP